MSAVRINYVAVVVAAIVVFAIGFFWYSPLLFQVAWIQAHGYSQAQIDGLSTSMGRTYGLSFVCILVMGVVLSILLGRTGTSTARGGATLGALVWLGLLVAPLGLTAGLKRTATAYVTARTRLQVQIKNRSSFVLSRPTG